MSGQSLLPSNKAAKLLLQTKSYLRERDRCLVVGIDPSTYNDTIDSNLTTLNAHLEALKTQLNSMEIDSALSEDQVRKEEDKVIRFSKALEELKYKFSSDKVSPDSPTIDPSASPSQVSLSLKPIGNSAYKSSHSEIDIPEEQETVLSPYTHLANSQLLDLQRQTFEEQDRNLEFLSQSIGRQREIGAIIGQELDQHVMLLDETNNAVDMTDSRLNQAQARLHRINRKAKRSVIRFFHL